MNKIPHVVWLVSYKGQIARITLKQSLAGRLPGFIYEHGQDIKWKLIEGKEHLATYPPKEQT